MKKNLLILCALTSLVGCTTVNYKEDLDTYKDCLTYVEDNTTGEAWVSNTASVKTLYDYYYEGYTVELKDLQLHDGATLKSATWMNLYQFYQETSNDDDTPLYYFFRQEGSTRTSGDLDVTSLRYGFLSNTYWMSFDAEEGQYSVWSIPRVRTLYATYNSVLGSTTLEDNAVQPAWRFKIDADAHTVTLDAKDVRYRQDPNDPSKSILFRELELPAFPVTFSDKGFTFDVQGPVIPTVDGQPAPQYEMGSFKGEIAFDYEGTKKMTYRIDNGEGQRLYVTTEFSLLRK